MHIWSIARGSIFTFEVRSCLAKQSCSVERSFWNKFAPESNQISAQLYTSNEVSVEFVSWTGNRNASAFTVLLSGQPKPSRPGAGGPTGSVKTMVSGTPDEIFSQSLLHPKRKISNASSKSFPKLSVRKNFTFQVRTVSCYLLSYW
jgi:hypothetical protein